MKKLFLLLNRTLITLIRLIYADKKTSRNGKNYVPYCVYAIQKINRKEIILKSFLILTICVICVPFSFSQQFNFRIYNVEKGLPKSAIFSILQDARGYLWLATEGGGICRFDGKNFVTFNKRNGLAGDVVRTLMKDSDGNLWVGTDDGISIYDGYKFITLNKKNKLPAFPVLKIFEDSKKNIWVGTSGGGLCKINKIKKDSFLIKTYTKDEDRIQTNYVFDIYEDASHRLWLALYGGINILTFDGEKISKILKLDNAYGDIPSNFILTIEKDQKGDLWFGSQDAGAFKIITAGRDSGKVVPYNISNGLNDNTVWDILCDSKGTMWLATDKGGINKLTDHGFLYITQQNGLPANQIYKLFEDDEGSIWIGTFGSGICQFLGENFTHFTETDGLPNKHVLSIAQDKVGKFWIATDGGGLAKLDFVRNKPVFKTYTTRDGLVDNFINDLTIAKDGAVWIASQKGVSRFDGKLFRNFSESDCKMLANHILSVYTDSKGVVWIGTNEGIAWYNGKKFISYKEEDEKFALFNYITTIIESKSGNVWLGTYGGLLRYGQPSVFYDEVEGLLHKQINCLAEDKSGNIYIGTFGGGLYKFDINSKLKTPISFVANDSLLSSNNISSLLFEKDNTLIVGTDKGFDKLFLNNGKVEKIINYNESDGFTGIENHLNSICRDNQDNIWFGTIKGLTRYNPTLDNLSLKPPKMHLTAMELFYQNINWLKKSDSITPWFHIPTSLTLKYSDNCISFLFNGISFFNPYKVQYKYMLEGLDLKWTPSRKEGEAVYTGLDPGDYTFKVISVNKYGKWNDEPVSFSFVIKPPFWKTTWFYIVSALFIILCFYLFLVLRLRKLKRDKRILEQKVKERTAEVVKQKQEIEEKNEELHQQNEEITAQRDQIQEQKHLVEEQHLEITDSIRYAKRIQSAIQPNDEYINQILSDYFILYRPKDIVSGDFYWITHRKQFTIIVAADCTGHGVPGAFMSMLGISFLNEIVSKDDVTHSNQVLDELRQYVVKSLQQKGVSGEQKDGMDIVFAVLDNCTYMLEYSGANNPLIHVRNGELTEYKADKMPIAIYEDMKPFTCTSIQLEKGDCIYLASDGYEDQFGGPKGKKFMVKQLKELLKTNSHLPMRDQKEKVESALDEWISHLDPVTGAPFTQVDDVLVIGVRV